MTIYVVTLCLINTFIHISGSYIPPGFQQHKCRDIAEALEDAINKLSNFYTDSNFNTTMYTPPRQFLQVDDEEYNNIRKYCSNHKSKFQNILDFKFQRTSVQFSSSHLSTCPWVFIENYDENRLPKIILEARCVCNRCLHKTNGYSGVQYVPGLGRCKRIMTSVMTVRRQCKHDSDVYKYVTKAERIAVGCTCTSPVSV